MMTLKKQTDGQVKQKYLSTAMICILPVTSIWNVAVSTVVRWFLAVHV